ncbi:MAG: acetate/propionate family kinase [Acidimicrobiia bacterium]
MRVLVVNCGSSSVRFDVVDLDGTHDDDGMRVATGKVEGLGQHAGQTVIMDGRVVGGDVRVEDHAAAVRALASHLRERGLLPDGLDAVGHRVVHGGEHHEPVVLTDSVAAALGRTSDLAPLHNVPAFAAVDAVRHELGRGLPMVAVFDTAFHAGLPEHASTYALPGDLSAKHGIRRYGFHGLAHRSMSERWAALTGVPQARLITLQLGNGASAAAVSNGRSLDTTMGFTPLEGLVMGTRCGDIDPAIPGFLARREGLDLDGVGELLNQRSGLLGLSGTTSDMKALLEARDGGDPRARLAVDVYCYRIRKQIGAYLAVLGGAEAVVFGGGIGESAIEIRRLVCEGMEWCGLVLDEQRNAATVAEDGRISSDRSAMSAWVIAVDEAVVIARDSVRCLARAGMGADDPLPASGRVTIHTEDFEAFVFDMDGVVTDTATLHQRAWKQLFDQYLAGRTPTVERVTPFSADEYRDHVDGRRRLDGVIGFLASRGIELPTGSLQDSETSETAWGLANRKNTLFHQAIEQSGVTVFESTTALIDELRARGLRIAVVTASRNAAEVLAAGGIADRFDVRVDGIDLEQRGLAGKPDPASFLEAVRQLGVAPARAVIFEDAISGVEAGRRGGFGLVVGVDRSGDAALLLEHGADHVVSDLSEINLVDSGAGPVDRG